MEEIRNQFETNLFGLVRVTKEVLPIMREQRYGYIVNVSSVGGKIAFPLSSVYNASKFAVEALTEALRVELAPYDIKVTAVAPGGVEAQWGDRLLRYKQATEVRSKEFESHFGDVVLHGNMMPKKNPNPE